MPTNIWETDEGEVEQYVDEEAGEVSTSITIMVPATFEVEPGEDYVLVQVWLDRRAPIDAELNLFKLQEYDVIDRLLKLTEHDPTRVEE